MFKVLFYPSLICCATAINASAQETTPVSPDTASSPISIIDTSAPAPSPAGTDSQAEQTSSSDNTPDAKTYSDSIVAKRSLPKEIPQPDYSNYHPVKNTSEESETASFTINPNSKIPGDFQPADTDKNDKITTGELGAVIDHFFEGDKAFTIDKINALIDFFFDQQP